MPQALRATRGSPLVRSHSSTVSGPVCVGDAICAATKPSTSTGRLPVTFCGIAEVSAHINNSTRSTHKKSSRRWLVSSENASYLFHVFDRMLPCLRLPHQVSVFVDGPTVFGNRLTLLPSAEWKHSSTIFQRHESYHRVRTAQKLLMINDRPKGCIRAARRRIIPCTQVSMQEQKIKVLRHSHAGARPVEAWANAGCRNSLARPSAYG